jgi:hypothetical protein
MERADGKAAGDERLYHLRGQNAELKLGALQHEIEMPDLDSKTINYSTLH